MTDSATPPPSFGHLEPLFAGLRVPGAFDGPGLRPCFARILATLLEQNKQTNLTRITDPARAVTAHFADALAGLDAAAAEFGAAQLACDIGSGGGFPVLALAAATPRCEWMAVESEQRKARCIADNARQSGLANVDVRAMRAEDFGRDPEFRESFDIATARAVGPVAALLEVGLPLVRSGGVLLLWKTEDAMDEVRYCEAVATRLGGATEGHHGYRFPGDEKERLILKFRKFCETPEEYPRRTGVPFKRPLSA